MDLILVIILSYALFRMAKSQNIRPWRWVFNYVGAFLTTALVAGFALFYLYGEAVLKDPDLQKKVNLFLPFTLLYEVILFFYFRTLMNKYVTYLDKVDEYKATTNDPRPQEGKQDFTHFR